MACSAANCGPCVWANASWAKDIRSILSERSVSTTAATSTRRWNWSTSRRTPGSSAVKLQKRTLANIYRKDLLEDPNGYEEGFRYLIPILKEAEFGRAEYDRIFQRARSRGLDFICTPFDEDAVDFLAPYDMPAFKIASGDMTNLILLEEEVIGTGKPLIISTGMATFDEIDLVGQFLQRWEAECILLHSVSAYPTPVSDHQLTLIRTLHERYGVPVGLSSHELGMEVSVASVALGACLIERHITLNRREEGPDQHLEPQPEELKEMVRRVGSSKRRWAAPRRKSRASSSATGRRSRRAWSPPATSSGVSRFPAA